MPASEQGDLTRSYKLVPRTLIFITCGSEILLLKGAPEKRLWANKYNGIGGHIERGEDVISGAQREILEETGLENLDLWICGVITIDTAPDAGIGIYVLRGECPEKMQLASKDGILEWVPKDQVLQLALVEDLYSILPLIIQIQPGSPPFSAHYSYEQDGKLSITIVQTTMRK